MFERTKQISDQRKDQQDAKKAQLNTLLQEASRTANACFQFGKSILELEEKDSEKLQQLVAFKDRLDFLDTKLKTTLSNDEITELSVQMKQVSDGLLKLVREIASPDWKTTVERQVLAISFVKAEIDQRVETEKKDLRGLQESSLPLYKAVEAILDLSKKNEVVLDEDERRALKQYMQYFGVQKQAKAFGNELQSIFDRVKDLNRDLSQDVLTFAELERLSESKDALSSNATKLRDLMETIIPSDLDAKVMQDELAKKMKMLKQSAGKDAVDAEVKRQETIRKLQELPNILRIYNEKLAQYSHSIVRDLGPAETEVRASEVTMKQELPKKTMQLVNRMMTYEYLKEGMARQFHADQNEGELAVAHINSSLDSIENCFKVLNRLIAAEMKKQLKSGEMIRLFESKTYASEIQYSKIDDSKIADLNNWFERVQRDVKAINNEASLAQYLKSPKSEDLFLALKNKLELIGIKNFDKKDFYRIVKQACYRANLSEAISRHVAPTFHIQGKVRIGKTKTFDKINQLNETVKKFQFLSGSQVAEKESLRNLLVTLGVDEKLTSAIYDELRLGKLASRSHLEKKDAGVVTQVIVTPPEPGLAVQAEPVADLSELDSLSVPVLSRSGSAASVTSVDSEVLEEDAKSAETPDETKNATPELPTLKGVDTLFAPKPVVFHRRPGSAPLDRNKSAVADPIVRSKTPTGNNNNGS